MKRGSGIVDIDGGWKLFCSGADPSTLARLPKRVKKFSQASVVRLCVRLDFFAITYNHESWVMIKRVRSQMQGSEMRYLQKIKCVTMFDKHRNTVIRECLNVKLLLFWNLSLVVWPCKQNGVAAESEAADPAIF